MNKLALYTGVDILFEKNFFIHQPTIAEISSMFSEAEFIKVLQFCTRTPQAGMEINNLLLFYIILHKGEGVTEEDRSNIALFLNFLFKDCQVSFIEQGILVSRNNQKEFMLIDNDLFIKFQEYIKEIFCIHKLFTEKEGGGEEFNPADQKAAEIAALLKKGRQKVADAKAHNLDQKSAFGAYLEILTVGLGIPMRDLANHTFFQLFGLVDRFSKKQSFDIDLKCRLAGAKGDKPLDNWMNI